MIILLVLAFVFFVWVVGNILWDKIIHGRWRVEDVIQLEGVPMEWLSTPEGRKRARKIFSRNAYKLRLY